MKSAFWSTAALLALVFACGCGGSSQFNEGPATIGMHGDSVEVIITGSGGVLDDSASPTKTMSLEDRRATAALQGKAAKGAGTISGCDIVPSGAVNGLGHVTSHNGVPIVPKATADHKADCATAGEDPLECFTYEVSHPVSAKFATISFTGSMYNVPTSDTDYILMRLKCAVHIDVEDINLTPLSDLRSTSRLVEYLTVDYETVGSPDFWLVSPEFDFLNTVLVDADEFGYSGWDTSIATGCAGGVYPTCDFSADSVRDVKPASPNLWAPNDFRKVISFSGKGSGQTQVIDFNRYLQMKVTTDGVTSGSLVKTFDNTYLSYLFCDNVDWDCPLDAVYMALSSMSTITAGGVAIGGAFDPSLVTIYYNGGTALAGTAVDGNISMTIANLPAGVPAPTITLTDLGTTATLTTANAWAYAGLDYELMIKGQRVMSLGNVQQIQEDVFVATPQAYPSMSTAFVTDYFQDAGGNYAYNGLAHDAFYPTENMDSFAEADALFSYESANLVQSFDANPIDAAAVMAYSFDSTWVQQYPVQAVFNIDDIVDATPVAGETVGVRVADPGTGLYYFAGIEWIDDQGTIHPYIVGYLRQWSTDHWVVIGGAKIDISAMDLSYNRMIKLTLSQTSGVSVDYMGDDGKVARLLSSLGCGSGAMQYDQSAPCTISLQTIASPAVSFITVTDKNSVLKFRVPIIRFSNLSKQYYITDDIGSE